MISQDRARLSNEVVINHLGLERLGYIFLVVGDVIRYLFEGNEPDPDYIQPRLAMIRDHHDLAIEYLNKRCEPFSIIPYLSAASQKSMELANSAISKGNDKLARREWACFIRLSEALANQLDKKPEDGQSWEDWIISINQEVIHV